MRRCKILVGLLAVSAGVAQLSSDNDALWVRLVSPVSSVNTDSRESITATVIAPFKDQHGIHIPSGSLVFGQPDQTKPLNRHVLHLVFNIVRVGNVDYPMRARVLEVDNAREQVTPDGAILAMEPIRKRPGKVELLLLAAAHAHPVALAFVEGSKLTLHEVEKPSVRYAAGTEMALRFETLPKVAIKTQSSESDPLPAPAKLAETLSALPQRTATLGTQKPSDWVNLAFAATRDDLVRSFESAGWTLADRLSARADIRVFLALADHHSYQHAPVSKLALAGRLPIYVYQKQTNTFAKRHHIRIWSTEREWDGRPLWVAAATHDIGIEFSTSAKTFMHKIDSRVDLERAKVVSDMCFSGKGRTVYTLSRPDVPAESQNATGDVVHTDGKIFVVKF